MAEFITPPRKLSDKTGKGIPGDGTRRTRGAEEAVDRFLKDVDYRGIAAPSLDSINACVRRLAKDPTDREAARHLFEVAHNLKGEGASFGYPAISAVADLLCRVTGEPMVMHSRSVTVIKIHVDALTAFLRENIKGNPQGLARAIIEQLMQLVDRSLSRMGRLPQLAGD